MVYFNENPRTIMNGAYSTMFDSRCTSRIVCGLNTPGFYSVTITYSSPEYSRIFRLSRSVRTDGDAFSQKQLNVVYVFFSDSCDLYSCSCHVLLAEFRTSVNLTGFHVFAPVHVFAQIFYFRTGGDAFSQKN